MPPHPIHDAEVMFDQRGRLIATFPTSTIVAIILAAAAVISSVVVATYKLSLEVQYLGITTNKLSQAVDRLELRPLPENFIEAQKQVQSEQRRLTEELTRQQRMLDRLEIRVFGDPEIRDR